jgi:hypothetical protein
VNQFKRPNHTSRRTKLSIAILAIAFLLILSSSTLVHLLTEAWWFDAVNFSGVFWTLLGWRVLTWLGTFVVFALVLGLNYRLAMRFTRDRSFRLLEGSELAPYGQALPNYIAPVLIAVISFLAAGASVGAWETILKFLNASEFGRVDPIYQRDIGFYLFRLPLYEGIQDWLVALLVCSLLVSVPIYVLKGKVKTRGSWQTFISGRAKAHISALLAGIAVLFAIDFWLERYDLLYSGNGVVFGAGYTDTHAVVVALWVMSAIALAVGTLFVVSMWRSSLALPLYGIGLYIAALVLVRGVFPSLMQQFIVEPNELAKERPYIEYNIESTNQAYQLDTIQNQEFPAETQLERQDLEQNQGTIRNVRLWDYRPLLSTYRQLQEIRPYYHFSDVDIDRYTLDGNYRQTMLSPRELDYSRVPARGQTWVNQRLIYTHGYGLVMSPVNAVTAQGLPELFIRDIPPVSEVDVEVERSGIYYGEETNNYIFTNTGIQEFDYPSGDENVFTTYDGEGGVPIPSIFHRLAYAYDLSSLNTLISGYFNDESRILYYRRIRERVNHVAPFLRLDNDPYITLIDGRLQWILDAYTVSDRYPYSEPVSQISDAAAILAGNDGSQLLAGGFNYARNSVKVLIDAFDGTMQFFVVDDTDPVLRTYRKIFPGLFEPGESVPPPVREHFRYPLNLFEIQAQMYLSYHMRDPQVFYNQEDQWRFPVEIYEGNERLMEPYYIIMRLPEAQNEEFILIMPFTPVNKDNMIAWMAARSDGENYGELLLYEFPKQKLIFGPNQIEARIDQNPQISQQLTLWSQRGSRVIRGDLLVIPIEESLLYVEPVYLRAEQGELPELKRVIVAYSEQIAMEETLEDSLAVIFGEQQPQQPTEPSPVPTATPAPSSDLIQSALETYRQAEQAAQQGNWSEYGRYQQELEDTLEQLNQEAGAEPTQGE